MVIEIDQSEKIEYTHKNTVVAFSNGIFGSIIIKSKEKRKIQEIFRKAGKPKIFVYDLFAALIFILLKKHINKIERIVIDEEYPGKENIIKNFLLREIRKIRPNFFKESIIFARIGKKSPAHFLAYGITTNKNRADIEVLAEDVMKVLIK